MIINGQTPSEERELIRAKFNADPEEEAVRVLLATDAAGEGIDLQAYCHRLVNFDVPFNPSRLEQRIGRIDRYGQTKTPEIYYFQPTGKSALMKGDMAFMRTIAEKSRGSLRISAPSTRSSTGKYRTNSSGPITTSKRMRRILLRNQTRLSTEPSPVASN